MQATPLRTVTAARRMSGVLHELVNGSRVHVVRDGVLVPAGQVRISYHLCDSHLGSGIAQHAMQDIAQHAMQDTAPTLLDLSSVNTALAKQ
jgi:hypothetical protein